MAIKVGINGYGRIGRNILRALYEAKRTNEIQIVAVNDLADPQTNAHLTQYDTAHGKFPGTVGVDGDSIVVNGDKTKEADEYFFVNLSGAVGGTILGSQGVGTILNDD